MPPCPLSDRCHSDLLAAGLLRYAMGIWLDPDVPISDADAVFAEWLVEHSPPLQEEQRARIWAGVARRMGWEP